VIEEMVDKKYQLKMITKIIAIESQQRLNGLLDLMVSRMDE